MPQVTFRPDQKAQLIGWLNREKDHLLSCRSMAERILIPRITGTLDCIINDLDFTVRLRTNLRGPDNMIEMSQQDIETLIDIAQRNEYANREEFWKGIIKLLDSQAQAQAQAQAQSSSSTPMNIE